MGMLVLSRLPGQSLWIGDILVTIVRTRRPCVTLQIETFLPIHLAHTGICLPAAQPFKLAEDQTVRIGDDIELVPVRLGRGGDMKVRLGIIAPKEIAVHRKEVFDAIKREGRAATSADLSFKKDAIDFDAICGRVISRISILCGIIDRMIFAHLHVPDSTRGAAASLADLCDTMLSAPRDLVSARSLLIGIKVSRRNLIAAKGSALESAIKDLLDQIPDLELAIDGSPPRGPSPLQAALPSMKAARAIGGGA